MSLLYGADKYRKVFSFEPDPIALLDLKSNIELNDFDNITLIDKALSDEVGIQKLGGNGELGQSMSTLLVKDESYIKNGGEKSFIGAKKRGSNIVDVPTTTLEAACEEHNINLSEVSLIKMDIEGGEIIAIPAIIELLRKHQIPLYISLHWVFLKKEQIEEILKLLLTTYKWCEKAGTKQRVTKSQIMKKQLDSLLFFS